MSSNRPASFRRLNEREVELAGGINGSRATDITVVTLPYGYRPTKEEHFILGDVDGNRTVITVAPDGRVIAEPGVGTMSLDGIIFETADPYPDE